MTIYYDTMTGPIACKIIEHNLSNHRELLIEITSRSSTVYKRGELLQVNAYYIGKIKRRKHDTLFEPVNDQYIKTNSIENNDLYTEASKV
jgi:hypothetical protein